MMRRTTYALAMSLALNGGAAAFDDSGHYSRQVVCISPGDDILMELYLPHSVVYGGKTMDNPKKPVAGYFSLDLDKLGKGKSIEPVRVWRDGKAKMLVVHRYSRGLPIARVPLDGGIVDFDNRFAEDARCKPYSDTREDESAAEFPPAPAADDGAEGAPQRN